MAIPPFDPFQPIPNNPFYVPDADRYSFQGPTGPLIFGDNFLVDYATGVVSIAPTGQRGTLINISGANGIVTVNSDIVTRPHEVTVNLAPLAGLVPGSYSYPQISVNQFGKTFNIVSETSGFTNLIGVDPIYIGGTSPVVTVNIRQASTTNIGAVQLLDSSAIPDNTKGLTSNQGYLLQQQVSVISANLGGATLGGIVNVVTSNVTAVTPDGAALPGISVGSPLPAASPTYEGLYFYTTGTGTYTPPGGVATACVPNDKVICIGGTWTVIEQGARLVQATTTTPGISTLATGADVSGLLDPSKFVTPGALSVMIASTTQQGFVELATESEAQALSNTTLSLTPIAVGAVNASTSARGIVQLDDTLTSTSVTTAATSNALYTYYLSTSISNSDWTAKGDLLVGLGPDSYVALHRGTNNSRLVVDTTKPGQGSLDWTVPDAVASWPLGAVIWNISQTIPALWLPCDGRVLDGNIGSPYFDLFEIIGTTYNTGGELPNFFRLPDLRGKFVRGWSGAGSNPTPTALDPGRGFATTQTSCYKQHNHNITDPGHFHDIPAIQHCHSIAGGGHSHAIPPSGSHAHGVRQMNTSAVGDGPAGWYDVINNRPERAAYTGGAFTGISAAAARTNITFCPAFSGITGVNSCTSGMTATQPSPPSPFTPNETRPNNVALIPIIRYANA